MWQLCETFHDLNVVRIVGSILDTSHPFVHSQQGAAEWQVVGLPTRFEHQAVIKVPREFPTNTYLRASISHVFHPGCFVLRNGQLCKVVKVLGVSLFIRRPRPLNERIAENSLLSPVVSFGSIFLTPLCIPGSQKLLFSNSRLS